MPADHELMLLPVAALSRKGSPGMPADHELMLPLKVAALSGTGSPGMPADHELMLLPEKCLKRDWKMPSRTHVAA